MHVICKGESKAQVLEKPNLCQMCNALHQILVRTSMLKVL